MNRRHIAITVLAGLAVATVAAASTPEAPPQPIAPQSIIIYDSRAVAVSADVCVAEIQAQLTEAMAEVERAHRKVERAQRESERFRLRTETFRVRPVGNVLVSRDLAGRIEGLVDRAASVHGPLLVSTPLPTVPEIPVKFEQPRIDFPGRGLAEKAALLLPEAIKVVKEIVRHSPIGDVLEVLVG